MSAYIVPILLLLLIIYSTIKKTNNYNVFVEGSKKSLNLVLDIFPYIATIFIAVEVFRVSGLSNVVVNFVSPAFTFLGIPKELCELVLLKPLSGSGSLALLSDVFSKYGADSYVGRCASVIMGSSETVFYITAVYFSKTNVKKLSYALPLAIFLSLFSAIIACLLCKFI